MRVIKKENVVIFLPISPIDDDWMDQDALALLLAGLDRSTDRSLCSAMVSPLSVLMKRSRRAANVGREWES